jgi:thymidylate synthase
VKQYLDLLRDVRDNGVRKPTRAVLKSTGKPVDAISVFGRQMRFDLAKGFPLATTKSVSFDAIVHELIWFLRGDTNIKYLRDRGVNIWNDWSDENGDVAFSYPECWRSFGDVAGYTRVDQIANLVKWIKDVRDNPRSPYARRLVLSAWNPLTVEYAALPPCHVMAIFNVTGDKLSCMLTQRSADCVLGVPYNIASYSLLTHILAYNAELLPGEFIHSIADAHVYSNHLDVVDEQLSRDPFPLPKLSIRWGIDSIDSIERSDFRLVDYKHHGRLKAEVAI